MLSLKKSPVDLRDYQYIQYIQTRKFPDKLDLIPDLPPIRDQGEQGTCAAQTAACMKEYQEKHNHGFEDHMSPQFVYNFRDYWNNDEIDGDDINEDYGMTCRDVMKILSKVGICPESIYPYGKREFSKEIPEGIVHKAYKYRIKSYAQIHTIDELKHSLFVNGPCMIAFPVYHMEDDMWKPRDERDIFLGGHAMTVVGYNNIGFIIRNSWGKGWGQDGYCIYPYEDWDSHWEIWTTLDLMLQEEDKEEDKEEDIDDFIGICPCRIV